MNKVLTAMLLQVLEAVISEVITPENIKKFGGQLFDFLEKVIADSSTKIDDVTLLPVVKALRAAFDIPR